MTSTTGTEPFPPGPLELHDHGEDWRRSWPPLFAARGLCQDTLDLFRGEILGFYQSQGRRFSWRENITSYRVLVSEIMLQQTQTGRVAEKFPLFIDAFPGFEALAAAPFSEVLRHWKGLGYNRRARYLHDIARLVVNDHDATLPDDPRVLEGFPGIGRATAAAICVFAYDTPQPFVETNIRTVFIHFFFPGRGAVGDRDILALVERTMDRASPRHWFYALMDYGVMLKRTVGNLSRKGSSYRRQSRFEGSDRQLRGRILDLLLAGAPITIETLASRLAQPEARICPLLKALAAEGFLVEEEGLLRLC